MHVLGASNESEIDAAFRTLVEFRADASRQAHFIRVKKKGTGAMSGKPGR
jgi:hypothetical protein